MKKTLIVLAVLAVSAQSSGASLLRKIVTYPIIIRNGLTYPIKAHILPQLAFKNCPVLPVVIGAGRGVRVEVPKRCCIKTIRFSKEDTRELLVRKKFDGNCVKGSASMKVYEQMPGTFVAPIFYK